MKICMIGKETTPIPPSKERAGAPQRWIWEVSKRLSKENEVIIYSPSHETTCCVKNGISIFYKKKRKEISINAPAILPYTQKILTYYINAILTLKKINPDILHFHSTAPYPVILAKKFLKNTLVVLSVHQCVGFRTLSLPIKCAEDHIISHSFRQADAILPVSNYIREHLKAKYHLPKNSKFYITYCGVDPSLFKYDKTLASLARRKYQFSQDPTILFVGRIAPEKAPHILISAYQIVRQKIPNAKLILAGPIQTRKFSHYALNIIRNNSKGVKFIGPLPHRELVGLYCAADVFVNPTIAPEAFGMVNIEAMACERPVIATQVGAIPEVVEHGKTGILVPPEEPKAISEAILYLLENNELAKGMGIAGRSKVLRHFTWDAVMRKTLRAYKKLIG